MTHLDRGRIPLDGAMEEEQVGDEGDDVDDEGEGVEVEEALGQAYGGTHNAQNGQYSA